MLKFSFKNSTPKPILLLPQPAWNVSERSQSNLHWERHLRDLLEISQKRLLFCDVFETSQIHLKKMSFCDVFKTSQKHLKKISFIRHLLDGSSISKKNVFSVTSLRRLKNISRKYLWFFKNTPAKIISCDFCRVITISGKIDVGPLETLKKWNLFCQQCMDINQVCHEYLSSSVGWHLRQSFDKSAIIKAQW